jgi:Skp family chaperone for outer membrane proteins
MTISRRSFNWPAAVLLAVLAGVIGHTTKANRPSAPSAPTVVASLNLETVFQGLEERAAADAKLTALAEGYDAEGQKRRDEIELLRQDLDLYAPGSPQFHEASQDVGRKGFELQAYLDFAVRKLDAEKSRSLRDIYASLKEAVESVANDNGYDVVFVDDSVVDLPANASETETMRQISARRMLYTSDVIDITQEVIARMNADFATAQGG